MTYTLNIEKHIEELKKNFETTAARHPLYESDNSEIPNVKYVKTKEEERQILQYLATSGFRQYDDYTLFNESDNVFVQLDEHDGRTWVYFIENVEGEDEPTQPISDATDVDQLSVYFNKIAQSLKTKATAAKSRNKPLYEMFNAYFNRFNHLEAQAKLNRKDRLVEDFQNNADEDMIGFIHSELSEQEANYLVSELNKLGLKI